jgi:hypothetical protein
MFSRTFPFVRTVYVPASAADRNPNAVRCVPGRCLRPHTDHPTSHVMQLVVFYFSKRFPGRGDSLKKEALKRPPPCGLVRPPESFSRYFQGYNIRFPFRPLTQSARWLPEESWKRCILAPSWQPYCLHVTRDAQRSKARRSARTQTLPTVRSGLGPMPTTLRTTKRSKIRRQDAFDLPDYGPHAGEHSPSRQQPSVVANNSSLIPPTTQFHPPAAE